MRLSLSEAVYAYHTLIKQGKYMLDEITSNDLDNEDIRIFTSFDYQYYYYYLFHYFQSLRKPYQKQNLERPTLLGRTKSTSEDSRDYPLSSNKIMDPSMIIPRESSLAPVEIRMFHDPMRRSDQDCMTVKFLWNINGHHQRLSLLTQRICNDHGLPSDISIVDDLKRQIRDASIVESDFATLVEWITTEPEFTSKMQQEFVKPIIICLNVPEKNLKLNECISWNIINSDWEVAELIKNITTDLDIELRYNVDMIYQFKKQILAYKMSVLTHYSPKLLSYAKQNGLRVPYICRNDEEEYNDDAPVLRFNGKDVSPDLMNKHRSSHKERLHYARSANKVDTTNNK